MPQYQVRPYGNFVDQSTRVETHQEYLARLEREAEANRKANEEAKQRWQAKLAADKQELEAKQAAEHEARIAQRIAVYRQQAQAAFPGTAAEFEAQWPQLLADWQRQQVSETMESNMARLRATGRYNQY